MSSSRIDSADALQRNATRLSSSVGRKWATPEEWDRHRQTIERLYLDEDKNLKEVMTIMAENYGHFGT